MSELLEHHLRSLTAARRAPSTIAARKWTLLAADRALQPYGIDNANSEDWTDYFADNDHWSTWTVDTYYRHADGFYQWATSGRDPWLEYNPLDELPRPRHGRSVPDPVTQEQFDEAYDRSSDWWRLVIILAGRAGLRAGDIVRLQREDITEDRIRIEGGKGDVDAELPTDPAIWEAVQGRPPGLLLRGERLGRPVTRARLSLMARKHFDRLNMPDVHLHRFRHYFATTLVRRGVDISIVRVLMRHTSILQTQIYVEIADEQRRLAISTLPVLNSRLSEPLSAPQVDMINRVRQSVAVPSFATHTECRVADTTLTRYTLPS